MVRDGGAEAASGHGEPAPNGRLRHPVFRVAYAACLLLGAPWIFLPDVGQWFLAQGHWWACILLRAFAATFLAAPPTVWLARRYGILDVPDRRKLHSSPMPRLGGLAVLAGVLLPTLPYVRDSVPLGTVLAGGTAVFLVSLWDDIRSLPAAFRLSVQACVCGFLIVAGIQLNVVPSWFPGEPYLNGTLTALWIIGLLNAVNFLDGIDGLASSLGFVGAALFLAVGWETRQSHLALLTAALAGACLGFLPYNWHRSVTFLGDGGATLIGFLLASVAVWGSWSFGDPVLSFSTPLLILAIPIFDMIYITASRIRNRQVTNVKEWLEFVGKDHLHHRLLKLGFTQPQAVVFVVALNLALGLAGLTIRATDAPAAAGLLIGQSVLIFLVISALMLAGRDRT